MPTIETLIEDNRPRDTSGLAKGRVVVSFDTGTNRGEMTGHIDDADTIIRHNRLMNKSLNDFLPYINRAGLNQGRQAAFQSLLTESSAYTIQYWTPRNCHQCAYQILKLFRTNPQLIPNDASVMLVSAVTNHSWIEVSFGDEPDKTRGNLVLDATGLSPVSLANDCTPYFGPKDQAPAHLLETYMNARGYRIELLDRSIIKTAPYHYWPWDENNYDPEGGLLAI